MRSRTRFIRRDDWCTLESCWNGRKKIALLHPASALVRVAYGPGRFSLKTQLQKLDGRETKYFFMGKWSIFHARVEIFATKEDYIQYSVD